MIYKSFLKMSDLELENKRVLIREDLNVPISEGKITNDERIQRALPTIKAAAEAGAFVMVMSHLGRPSEGQFDDKYSLEPVAKALSAALNQQVRLCNDWIDGVDVNRGDVVLLENVRFLKGEKINDDALAKKMASLCDVFVMDAFATAHRAQASTVGVAKYAPEACAGPLLIEELNALSDAFTDPAKPMAAIVGGSKVSTKIKLLDSLIDKVDLLIVGGGIANTFLKAQGVEIGKSLYEPDWVEKTKQLIEKADKKNVRIPLPSDVVVAKSLSADAKGEVKALEVITAEDCIFDVGPKTAATYEGLLAGVNTIVWNGPVGVFEIKAFAGGTEALAKAIAKSGAFSVAGGGDTLVALDQFGIRKDISYISTGGGAFLTYLEGGFLPAIDILIERY